MLRVMYPNMTICTPAIRPAWAFVADGRRRATLAEAIFVGANRIVVGRSITQASDPYAAAMRT